METNTLEFLLAQAGRSVRRNGLMTLAAVCNMAVSLAILGAFALVAVNLDHMASMQANSTVVTVDLAKGADAQAVQSALLADSRIAKAKFVSKDEALAELAKKNRMDIGALKLLENPLPDSVRVQATDPNQIGGIVATAKGIRGVADVRYGGQVTEKLLAVSRGVKKAGLVLGLVLGFATLLVVNTTIRLTIYARRREVRIMQLVGATNWFIRMPFLLEGMFHGLIGGVLAATLLLVGYSYASDRIAQTLSFLDLILGARSLAVFAVGITLCGLVFGAVGALMGLQRYLKQV
jgi:cell division transport system permease protein